MTGVRWMRGAPFAVAVALAGLAALPATPATAAETKNAGGVRGALTRFLGGSAPVVPPEWAGIWAYDDSTTDCAGKYLYSDAGEDTLCAGGPVFVEDPTIVIECTGTATATTVDLVCTSVSEVFPGCDVTSHWTIQGTRTGDTYGLTTEFRMDFDGSALGCDQIPDECIRTYARGTRIAPAPEAYCATPARPTSWGGLKSRYR